VQNLDGTYSNLVNTPANGNIGVVLRWRYTASANWDSGPWTASLSQNYQNGYHDIRTPLQPASVPTREVSSYVTYDMQASYNGFKDVKLTLGVKNLGNTSPPYTNYGGGFVGGYDLSYADVRGRFLYLTAGYTFK
jgi:iron complex outermembrane receptor protein